MCVCVWMCAICSVQCCGNIRETPSASQQLVSSALAVRVGVALQKPGLCAPVKGRHCGVSERCYGLEGVMMGPKGQLRGTMVAFFPQSLS